MSVGIQAITASGQTERKHSGSGDKQVCVCVCARLGVCVLDREGGGLLDI